ncbi:MAG: endonuclease III [Methanophagales archaeon]|nr:endonuclease III [Methanophagales archaeon]
MDVSNAKDPFKVLISCLLSLRTKDDVTAKATKRLFERAKTPEELVKLKKEEIEAAIYPVGFYHRKAEQIIEISRGLLEKYDSRVPDELDELLKLKGVGRKTANIVVTMGYKKPGVAVDTHVHRLSNRLGLVATKTPYQTEFALRETLAQKYWIIFNGLLVMHGQTICTPISPRCSICPITEHCKRVGVTRSR